MAIKDTKPDDTIKSTEVFNSFVGTGPKIEAMVSAFITGTSHKH